jgi:hypothetical protein
MTHRPQEYPALQEQERAQHHKGATHPNAGHPEKTKLRRRQGATLLNKIIWLAWIFIILRSTRYGHNNRSCRGQPNKIVKLPIYSPGGSIFYRHIGASV